MAVSNPEVRWNQSRWLFLSGNSGVNSEEAQALLPALVTKAGTSGVPTAPAFVESNVRANLNLYINHAPVLKVWFRLFGLLVFGSGLTSSALAAFSMSTAARVTIAVLGVVVGLVTHLLQFWRPAERASAYFGAQAQLMREGWSYVSDDGVYAPLAKSPRDQFLKFQRQVEAIETAAGAIDKQAPPLPGSPEVPGSPQASTSEDAGAEAANDAPAATGATNGDVAAAEAKQV